MDPAASGVRRRRGRAGKGARVSILGNRVLRKEDPRFLRGEGTYVEHVRRTQDWATARADEGSEPPSDISGSAEYRAHLARVLVRRALDEL